MQNIYEVDGCEKTDLMESLITVDYRNYVVNDYTVAIISN